MAGKIITISSVKGGVGKTTMTLNLAGIYCELNKRVLIIDLDLYSGGIAASLNVKNKKDIYTMIDSMANNRFTELKKYVTTYNKNIDVLACPKDPRMGAKVSGRYIPVIFDLAKKKYDVVLVDTYHILDEINLTALDYSYMTLFIITNDIVDLKNMKSLISIFKDTDKKNYITASPYMADNMNVYVVKIARYLEKTSNHVMYRTTPVFVGEELMCRGILMEAYSVEDSGEGICFNIFLYNVQPGINYIYSTGESEYTGEFLDIAVQMKDSSMDYNYILNSKTMTFHKPECEKASRIGTKNKIYSYAEREELIGAGYTAAECCNP